MPSAMRVGTWEVRIDGKLYVGRNYSGMANAVFAALRVHENAWNVREHERWKAAFYAEPRRSYKRRDLPKAARIDVTYANTPGPAKMQAA